MSIEHGFPCRTRFATAIESEHGVRACVPVTPGAGLGYLWGGAGATFNNPLKDNDEFTPTPTVAEGTWRTLLGTALLDPDRNAHAAFAIGGAGFVAGGQVAPSPDVSSDLFRFTQSTEAWDARLDMPNLPGETDGDRRDSAGATANGDGFVFGGRHVSNGPHLDEVIKYDAGANTWAAQTDMLAPHGNRRQHAAGVVADKVYVSGGEAGLGVGQGKVDTGQHDEFDPVANAWASKQPLPSPITDRRNHIALTIVDKLYVLGGQFSGSGLFPLEVDRYEPAIDTWVNVLDIPLFGSGDPAGFTVSETMVVNLEQATLGGDGSSWTTLDHPSPNRRLHTGVTI